MMVTARARQLRIRNGLRQNVKMNDENIRKSYQPGSRETGSQILRPDLWIKGWRTMEW